MAFPVLDPFIWEVRLEISVWKRSLGNFGSGICLWELSLWTSRSGNFTWTLPLGNVWLGVFSPIRLAYNGFLLYSKAIGGLLQGVRSPGSPGNRPPRVPRAPRARFPAPKSKSQTAFGILNCQKVAFGVLSCQNMPSPKVEKSKSPKVLKSKNKK